MIASYQLKYINNEEVLILNLDYNYEISKIGSKKTTFKQELINFLKHNNIKFYGKKILICSCGIVLSTLLLITNDEKEEVDYNYVNNSIINNKISLVLENDQESNYKEIKKDNNSSVKQEKQKVKQKDKTTKKEEADIIVSVYRLSGKVLKIELEEYVIGVVGAEMPASFDIEALKAQAILARTYALKSIEKNRKLTDTVSTQSYKDKSQLKDMWKSDYSKYYNKIKKAVNETRGMVITYNGEYIEALYHSTSNGKTEEAREVFSYSYPYLVSVNSYWDKNVTSYSKTIKIDVRTALNKLGVDSTSFEIIERSKSNRVRTITFGNKTFTGVEFRNLLGLRSTDFDLEIKDDILYITTRGYGHGVGMSQYGANEMAKKGNSYKQIIKHYYQGTSIKNINN